MQPNALLSLKKDATALCLPTFRRSSLSELKITEATQPRFGATSMAKRQLLSAVGHAELIIKAAADKAMNSSASSLHGNASKTAFAIVENSLAS